jgi:hypothetical protein
VRTDTVSQSGLTAMADGWRPERRKEQFTAMEAEQLERAAKRLAAAFGYGSGWMSTTLEMPEMDTWGEGMAPLTVAYRGHVTEQAARSIDGSKHVRRQHAWAVHGGIVAIPTVSPDPFGQAALSFARLRGPLEPLLLAYALESMPHWLRVEPFLHAVRPSCNPITAGRDAMARIMYAEAATPVDQRARELGTRAATYREETRGAEYVLRDWLVRAATIYNPVGNARSSRPGSSHANGLRTSTFWNQNERAKVQRCTLIVGRNYTLKAA